MKCRESALLPSEVDAAVSGETSLDHESAARVGGDRPHDGHVDGDILSATMPALIAINGRDHRRQLFAPAL
jgi:hypothetical protein